MRQRRDGKARSGFTLIELMVVIAVIGMLAVIILAAISTARQNTREKVRVSDLGEIEFALTLYREANRNYPSFPSGVQIGTGGTLDTQIQNFIGSIPRDPREGGVYGYWYDSNFTCSDTGQAVVFVRTMEQAKNANFDDVCTDPSADTTVAGASSYVQILKQ